MIKVLFKSVLPLVLMAGSIVGAMAVVGAGRRQEAPLAERRPPLVRVSTARAFASTLDVTTYGTVSASNETEIVARVAGTVHEVSQDFHPGAFIEKGETLLDLDRADLLIRKTKATARVTQARAALTRVEAAANVARNEWKSYGKGKPDPVALHEPEVAAAKAELKEAKASVTAIELDLARTRIVAPYDGRIVTTSADVGQFVSPGTPLCRIYETSSFEVRLPVTESDLAFLDLPMEGKGSRASSPLVEITASYGARQETWTSRIVRTAADVNPKSRVVYAIARIDHPFARTKDHPYPPLPGMFVTAVIHGRKLPGAVEVPEEAVRAGPSVLVVDGNRRVRSLRVRVVRDLSDGTAVVDGIQPGQPVCLDDVHPFVDGMTVRVAKQEGAR